MSVSYLNITHYNGRMASTLVAVGAPPTRFEGVPVAASAAGVPSGYVRVWAVRPADGTPSEFRIRAQAANYHSNGDEILGNWVATIDVPIIDHTGQVHGAQAIHISAEPIPDL